MRFPGSLNVDLNELAMNLVPFPRLHYILSAMTPVYTLADKGPAQGLPRRLAAMFREAVAPGSQLLQVDPKHDTYAKHPLDYYQSLTLSLMVARVIGIWRAR